LQVYISLCDQCQNDGLTLCYCIYSDTGEMDDDVMDLVQHIQRMHCAESPSCICLPSIDQKVRDCWV